MMSQPRATLHVQVAATVAAVALQERGRGLIVSVSHEEGPPVALVVSAAPPASPSQQHLSSSPKKVALIEKFR